MYRKGKAQNWKICILYIYWEYLLRLQSNASGSFLQTCINFVEKWLKFSHFQGSIILNSNFISNQDAQSNIFNLITKKVGLKGVLLNLNPLFTDKYARDIFIFKCQKHFNHYLLTTWSLPYSSTGKSILVISSRANDWI